MALAIWLSAGLPSAGAAYAAPPQSRAGILTRTNEPSPAHPGAAALSPGTSSRLDLRPPDFFRSASIASQPPAARAPSEFAPFPAMRRNAADDERPVEEHPKPLGTQQPRMTEESRAQEMARRFHREGLPVARLWESRTALVSLGLNQRGKPGLWLIQKIP